MSTFVAHHTNATEAELVSAGFITEESSLHDVAVAGDGSMTITNVRTGAVVGSALAGGGGGGAAPEPDNVAQVDTYAGFDALRYGTGAKTLAFLDSGNPQARIEFDLWVLANPPIADTQFIFITDPSFSDHLDVEAAIALNATAYAAPYDFGFRWTTTAAPQVPIWWIRGGGVGATGTFRSPGLGNVIQWDDNSESVTVVVANFLSSY